MLRLRLRLVAVGEEQIILLVSGGVWGRVIKKIIPQSIIYLHSLSGGREGEGGCWERLTQVRTALSPSLFFYFNVDSYLDKNASFL